MLQIYLPGFKKEFLKQQVSLNYQFTNNVRQRKILHERTSLNQIYMLMQYHLHNSQNNQKKPQHILRNY